MPNEKIIVNVSFLKLERIWRKLGRRTTRLRFSLKKEEIRDKKIFTKLSDITEYRSFVRTGGFVSFDWFEPGESQPRNGFKEIFSVRAFTIVTAKSLSSIL